MATLTGAQILNTLQTRSFADKISDLTFVVVGNDTDQWFFNGIELFPAVGNLSPTTQIKTTASPGNQKDYRAVLLLFQSLDQGHLDGPVFAQAVSGGVGYTASVLSVTTYEQTIAGGGFRGLKFYVTNPVVIVTPPGPAPGEAGLGFLPPPKIDP